MNRWTLALAIASLVMSGISLSAQDLNNPGAYMDAITSAKLEMNQQYMAYMSVAAHRRRAK